MAAPTLTKAEFPSTGIHKKKTTGYSTVIVFSPDVDGTFEVNVNGTRGQVPTNWKGKITKKVADGIWLSDKLEVTHEEEKKGRVKVAAGGSTEDVAVTVSNSTDTSPPVITKDVPTIP
jgi:hypothetical protein